MKSLGVQKRMHAWLQEGSGKARGLTVLVVSRVSEDFRSKKAAILQQNMSIRPG